MNLSVLVIPKLPPFLNCQFKILKAYLKEFYHLKNISLGLFSLLFFYCSILEEMVKHCYII
ncbi:unnamed protein product [Candidatus Protochlamydia amoebophila UWE25]|uniref:Uncharacterized protein n=1 Tax=Protochlamydia amoebophila (strain UWE25) TaxID=264201 RepID=Q6M9S5_PARUW|nr:unnamed protein product [Candidatus Protochlamydia amoebophila UWE25]